MKLTNSYIFGLILSFLFHQLKGSFLNSLSCCGFWNNIDNNNNNNIYRDELDERVYDPYRGHERRRRMRERMNANPVAIIDVTKDTTGIKSILKVPQVSDGLVENPPKRTLKKTVSFAPDTVKFFKSEDLPENTSSTNAFLTSNLEPEPFAPIMTKTPHDYKVEGGEEAFVILRDYNFPRSIVQLMVTSYPSLEKVRLTLEDFAGLVLFAKYYTSTIKFFNAAKLLNFFHVFLTAFPHNLDLVQTIQVDLWSSKLTKASAFNGLLNAAFKHSLYCTIEAFYSAFSKNNVDFFIKKSVHSLDEKLFERFILEKPDINPQKLVRWSIQSGNVNVFNRYMDEIMAIESLKPHFTVPIIIFIAKQEFYFPGIVNELFESESEHFDEALKISISTGNNQLFKDLILFDNIYFSKSHDPKILTILRTIYTGGPTRITEFETEDSLRELFMIILMLDSNEPGVLKSFRESVPDLITSEFITDILLLSLFLKTRDYMTMILECSYHLKLTIITERDGVTKHIGLWSLIVDTSNYFDTMKIISKSHGFHILHAIANPNFPKSLWPDVIIRFIDGYEFFYGLSYDSLCETFGFNSDILSRNEFDQLHLLFRSSWTLLELSVLNLNLEAVIHLREHYDDKIVIASLHLAKSIKAIIDSQDYMEKHPMISLSLTNSLIEQFKSSKPHNFNQEENEVVPPEALYLNLKITIDQIITILDK